MESSIPSSILFLDIETVPAWPSLAETPERFRNLWERKAASLARHDARSSEELFERAGIYSEFGKIICISVGYVADGTPRLKSFAGHDESQILHEFADLLNNYPRIERLCGHNCREFDLPYICRRMVAHRIPLPRLLDLSGRKPWEVPHIDTMELWKFGDVKSFVSLELLAAVLGIPSSKTDMDGSQVYKVYYELGDLERIVRYCEQDVRTLMAVYARLAGFSWEGLV